MTRQTREEQNDELDRQRDLSQQPAPVSDETHERIWHPERDHERRRAGFPSTFGPLARRAEEQAETGNEARARRLSPTTSRLAQEAETMTEPPPGLPYWLGVAAIVVASASIVVLALACVNWGLVNMGYIAP
jgi:hypothetical protein